MLTGCASPAQSPPGSRLVSDGRWAMGTVLEVTLVTHDEHAARERIDDAFEVVDALEARLTRFDPASELSQLNAAAGRGSQPVSNALGELIERAVQYAKLTDGAFDVTIGPLVTLWIEAANADQAPQRAALDAARRHTGSDRIGLGASRVALPSGFSMDLGGIAKGYALDRVAGLWDGDQPALLSFGQSSVLARGAPPGAEGWRMVLRSAGDALAGVLTLRDQAFSVSSTLGQWSEIGGERYGHVIDPRSGWALQRAALAAVVDTNATRAEALSTALVILEPARGIAIVEEISDCEARVERADGAVFESSGWRAATRFEPMPAREP